jgi:glucose-6-phosphate 1-dehydrogenase
MVSQQTADLLVIFGITGDLARVMTFRSLYRLLDAPPPVQPYAPGSWGPEPDTTLVHAHGDWRGPWIVG